MNRVFSISIIFLLIGCASGIPKDTNLEWQYNHSTDVAHFNVLRTLPMEIEAEKCNFIVWELEAIQTFKGNLLPGDKIQVWGPNDPEYWQVGGERLMFLRMYEGNGYNSCSTHLFRSYKQVHWSCCEITEKDGAAEVQFETMLNSEQRGPDIPVDANKVFEALRSYEAESPNKRVN
ncbi:hypothetical protein [Pseudoalteromonas sp. T1lg10]|uniref:hypothetical protein n=1 Tax=Pseudoalteromonas sp. T1lg10 TaxID=2077093 RepID=UPI000CF6B13C|nr:hypothetical protein [Pseudoalteromonas sp. T1lg10]